MRTASGILLLLMATGCGKPSLKSPSLKCSTIHEPKGGCPTGYTKESSPRFTERNGSKEYACVSPDPNKEGCTDYLDPGEMMGVPVEFEIEREPAGPPKS
jgi:hypothetical protein